MTIIGGGGGGGATGISLYYTWTRSVSTSTESGISSVVRLTWKQFELLRHWVSQEDTYLLHATLILKSTKSAV